jgi:hypothetical protein
VFFQFSGSRPWYTIMHESNDFENNLDCLKSFISRPDGNRNLVTTDLYNIRLVHIIDCFFTEICVCKSMQFERWNFYSKRSMGHKSCDVISVFNLNYNSPNFRLLKYLSQYSLDRLMSEILWYPNVMDKRNFEAKLYNNSCALLCKSLHSRPNLL